MRPSRREVRPGPGWTSAGFFAELGCVCKARGRLVCVKDGSRCPGFYFSLLARDGESSGDRGVALRAARDARLPGRGAGTGAHAVST